MRPCCGLLDCALLDVECTRVFQALGESRHTLHVLQHHQLLCEWFGVTCAALPVPHHPNPDVWPACPAFTLQVCVSRCYGRLYQDSQYKDLFHIPCCDPGQAFVFDFEHTGSGVYNERFKAVTLQTAFQYSAVVPASTGLGPAAASSSNSAQQQQQQGAGGPQTAGAGAAAGGDGAPLYVVQRRLRVCTVRCVSPAGCCQACKVGWQYGSTCTDNACSSLAPLAWK